MNKWSEKDKAVFKNAVARVQKRARDAILKEFKAYKVDNPEQLWKLEQEIRTWRKEVSSIIVKYDNAETDMINWIRKGWLRISDINSMSDKRLSKIKAKI